METTTAQPAAATHAHAFALPCDPCEHQRSDMGHYATPAPHAQPVNDEPLQLLSHAVRADAGLTPDDLLIDSPLVIINEDTHGNTLVDAPGNAGIIGNTNGDATAIEWRHPKDSRPIRWRTRAHSPAARALVHCLLGKIEEHSRRRASDKGKRAYRRGPNACAKLLAVVEGFVGDLIVNAAQSRMSHHPVRTHAFQGLPVGYRAFDRVRRTMEALGYVEALAGFSWLANGWSEDGGGPAVLGYEATRFRPADRLLKLAEDMGVRLSRILAHFRATPRAKSMDEADLVQVRTLGRVVPRPGMRPLKLRGERLETFEVDDGLQRLHLSWLRKKVVEMNTLADRHRITHGPADDPVALRPQWYRVFTHQEPLGFDLHGRWYAAGGDYQNLPRADVEWGRPSLRIDGEAVVEVDARASHLCLLAGIAGDPLTDPSADPYALSGFDRTVVKAYIAAAIGAGHPPRVWTRRALADAKEAGVTLPRSVRDVREVVLARYPFLDRLPEVLGCQDEPRLCGHVMMGVESRVLTSAILALADKSILALPLHDAMLVRERDVEAAREALARSYELVGQVRVMVRAKAPSA
jgi:hypothetical protein